MVDDASGWLEIVAISNKKINEIAYLNDSEWFCWYPGPLIYRYNKGGAFNGHEFQELLKSYGVESEWDAQTIIFVGRGMLSMQDIVV